LDAARHTARAHRLHPRSESTRSSNSSPADNNPHTRYTPRIGSSQTSTPSFLSCSRIFITSSGLSSLHCSQLESVSLNLTQVGWSGFGAYGARYRAHRVHTNLPRAHRRWAEQKKSPHPFSPPYTSPPHTEPNPRSIVSRHRG
jgi:hypothetical protein